MTTKKKPSKGDILVVDDRLENVGLLFDMLTENGYEVREVLSGQQALKTINHDPPELILLDIMMPEMDGYEVCKQIKANPKTTNIPVLFISAKGTLFDKVKAFQVGGADYITKPFFLAEVLCRVETHISNYRYQKMLTEEIATREKIQQALELANQELQRLANLDGLTQIYNRRYFDDYLCKEWYRLRREQQPLSLIMIDIDYFKKYNDTYGHLLGDEILKKVAQTITHVVKRPADLVARYGGEEFAVILPNTDGEGAKIVAQNIAAEISKLAIEHQSSLVSKYITLSMGISSIIPPHKTAPKVLIDKADQALYHAKEQGRNRISYELLIVDC
jgi:diguanylate cyclase (GGDEF)-like protein